MTPASQPWRVLVVAKAPVAGQAKTRLAASVGDETAAELAAAALLDTLAAAAAAVGPARCVLALTGDLDAAAGRREIRRALSAWTVVAQRGTTFAERLAHAHADAGPGPRVQVGMDTPQVTPAELAAAAAALRDHDAVLAPADDGGWWALALRAPAGANALRRVPMSTPTTFDETLDALRGEGLTVTTGPVGLRDVDEVEDAAAVAAAAPATRFAGRWRHHSSAVAR